MKQKPVTIKSKQRIQIMLVIVTLGFVGLFGRLIWIQLFKGEEYQNMAYENRFQNLTIKARRGVIYDTNGKPLAISISTDSFYATPSEVVKSEKADEIAGQLALYLDMDKEDVLKKITNTDRNFMYVKRKVEKETADAVKALELPGIYSHEEPERVYPKGTLLANMLGFVGLDNNGLSGIEASYESVLSGKNGTLMVEQDTRSQSIVDAAQKYIAPVDGSSLVLTIDESIQYICERELANMVAERQPDKAGILVMEPKTGRVLAMAEYPTFDPNNYGSYPEESWRNMLISDAYEPGSTFKTVVMSGALEEGVASLNDYYYCGGAIKLKGGTIRCWKLGAHGSQSFLEAVQNSCNPAFITIGQNLGKDLFFKYLNGFGFGQKTGIQLSGESTGILVNQKTCSELDLGSMSIGQSNAVTPIQLLNAFSAICNGGNLMKPQVVREIRDAQGGVLETVEPEVVRQVISPETSRKVLDALETVVSVGTGKTAYIKGYRVGGKTGTAQKILPTGGYSKNEFIASFMGVAPVNDPQIVVLVVCDNPKTSVHTGGAVCGPVFKAAATDILNYMKISAQVDPRDFTGGVVESVTLPDLCDLSVDSAQQKAWGLGLSTTVVGSGDKVIAQLPLANTKMVKGGTVVLYTKLPASLETVQQIPVPELAGKTAEEIQQLSQEYNLSFEITGQGTAMYQEPTPGTMVNAGSTVYVSLEEPIEEGAMGDLAGP